MCNEQGKAHGMALIDQTISQELCILPGYLSSLELPVKTLKDPGMAIPFEMLKKRLGRMLLAVLPLAISQSAGLNFYYYTFMVLVFSIASTGWPN